MDPNPSLEKEAFVLFADLQTGIVERATTIDRQTLGRGVRGLATLAKIFELPVIVTTVPVEEGKAPVLIPELEEVLGTPSPLLRFTTDSFDNPAIRAAIEATGRKTMLISGVAVEVAVARPALRAVRNGYQVQIVLDACGGVNARSEDAVLRRLVQAGVVTTSIPALAGEFAADFSQPKAQQALGVLMGA